ncbi:uncharacterized protein LOC112348550 [Selaginella moellendorffii]|uniref:uncharacterized protein LOC112348550 n=1 Tax=Selaginella moellendorffii TaxID=88036 RepID=UPI000D1CB291|nr:uncharacterized protein LOC112348550 [Selaginella moellendorffii]|eukprot:XP_024537079.1 uncharacterized protein LOC112348550 [Selaginella moellendorffii]
MNKALLRLVAELPTIQTRSFCRNQIRTLTRIVAISLTLNAPDLSSLMHWPSWNSQTLNQTHLEFCHLLGNWRTDGWTGIKGGAATAPSTPVWYCAIFGENKLPYVAGGAAAAIFRDDIRACSHVAACSTAAFKSAGLCTFTWNPISNGNPFKNQRTWSSAAGCGSFLASSLL